MIPLFFIDSVFINQPLPICHQEENQENHAVNRELAASSQGIGSKLAAISLQVACSFQRLYIADTG
jgi:hypothetical protein